MSRKVDGINFFSKKRTKVFEFPNTKLTKLNLKIIIF